MEKKPRYFQNVLRNQAIANRKTQTNAEEILWEELRNRKLAGLKFRRQFPISRFIIDFYCAEKLLGIEVDGGYHGDNLKSDQERSEVLKKHGIRMIRFNNAEIFEDLESVLSKIIATTTHDSVWPAEN